MVGDGRPLPEKLLTASFCSIGRSLEPMRPQLSARLRLVRCRRCVARPKSRRWLWPAPESRRIPGKGTKPRRRLPWSYDESRESLGSRRRASVSGRDQDRHSSRRTWQQPRSDQTHGWTRIACARSRLRASQRHHGITGAAHPLGCQSRRRGYVIAGASAASFPNSSGGNARTVVVRAFPDDVIATANLVIASPFGISTTKTTSY
jgi:hypothetical protein